MQAVVIAVVALCVSTFVSNAAAQDRDTPAGASRGVRTLDVRGFWEHDACQVAERDGVQSGSRSLFAIFEREWGIAFTQFADGACTTPVMTALLRGTYEQTGASRRVPGAVDAIFRFSYKGIVAHDAALVAKLNAGTCGARTWRIGVEQDVTATGCLSIASRAACGQEYDVIAIVDDRLYLGERPQPGEDICADARRPPRLRGIGLRRR